MVEKESQQSANDIGLGARHSLQNASFLLAVALSTIGWAVGGVASLAVSRGSIAAAVTYPVGWAIGGGVTALVLYWAHPAIQWQHTLTIMIGWIISWPISMAFCGATGGLAGAVVVLISGQKDKMPTVFVASLIIGLVIAGTISGFVTGMITQRVSPSIRKTSSLSMVIGWLIAWVIGGVFSWALNRSVISPVGWAIGGAIGNGVMYWQLGRTGAVQDQL